MEEALAIRETEQRSIAHEVFLLMLDLNYCTWSTGQLTQINLNPDSYVLHTLLITEMWLGPILRKAHQVTMVTKKISYKAGVQGFMAHFQCVTCCSIVS